MTDLNFAKIFPPLCSCGYELGYFQKEIEDMIENNNGDIIEVFNTLKLKICCRTNILVASKYIITSIDTESFRDESFRDETGLSLRQNITKFQPIIQRYPNPSRNSFPSLPLLSIEMNTNIIPSNLPSRSIPALLNINKK